MRTYFTMVRPLLPHRYGLQEVHGYFFVIIHYGQAIYNFKIFIRVQAVSGRSADNAVNHSTFSEALIGQGDE